MNKEVDLEVDAVNVMLLDDNHSFVATHNQKSEIVANEISGDGYDAGGKALANKGVTQGATTKFDADDIAWTSSTFTAYFAVLYDDDLTNDDLICCIDFGGAKAVSGGTFTIQWHEDGIITLT
jgi:hypothetical protein